MAVCYMGIDSVVWRRFVVAGNPETLAHFEAVLHAVCTAILQQDVERELLAVRDGLVLAD